MVYAVNNLKSTQECDTLLRLLTRKKKNLAFETTKNTKNQDDLLDSSVDLQAAWETNNGLLAAQEIIVANQVPGPKKEKEETKRQALVVRKRSLAERIETGGAIAYIQEQYDSVGNNFQLIELEDLIAQVQARKAAF